MKHLHWIVLNDGVAERVMLDDIDPVEEAALIDRVLIPISNSEIGLPRGRDSGYAATGEIASKYAMVTLYDEGAPIAFIAVCLHSRAARGLWARITSPAGPGEIVVSDADRPPHEPWCAVRCAAPEAALPPWFDSWTQTLGVALMRREGW